MPVGLIIIVCGIMVLAGAVLVSFGLYYLIRDKRFMGTPNTPMGSLTGGEVAVRGIVRTDERTELRTPVGKYPCVWYHTRLDYYKPAYVGGKRGNIPVKIYERTEGDELILTDDTGSVLVKLHGAKPVLSTKIERTIGYRKWPEGFDAFTRESRLRIDMGSRFDNSYHYLQEHIPPGMDLKVKGLAHRPVGAKPMNFRPGMEFIIKGTGVLPESYLMTDTKEGRMTREGRIRFLTFSIFGGAIICFGIFLMVTYLLKYG
ncbi:MAG: hypothetical protein ACMUHY_07075 [Thermoplasmatota archaeon]